MYGLKTSTTTLQGVTQKKKQQHLVEPSRPCGSEDVFFFLGSEGRKWNSAQFTQEKTQESNTVTVMDKIKVSKCKCKLPSIPLTQQTPSVVYF